MRSAAGANDSVGTGVMRSSWEHRARRERLGRVPASTLKRHNFVRARVGAAFEAVAGVRVVTD